MNKCKKYLFITIVFCLLHGCLKKNQNIIDKHNWVLIKSYTTQSVLNIGDTLEFTNNKKYCRIGKMGHLAYYSNDSLLLINYPDQQRVYKIEYELQNLMLTELFSSEQNKYELKAISN